MPPTTATRLARTGATLLLALATLAGCATTDKPHTRFYVLSPLPADTAPVMAGDGARPLAVDVAELRLPQYLQRPQIVTRSADNQVSLAEYEQWGGSLEKDMTRVLARNLARLLATPEITIFSRRPPRPADVRVEVEVLEFERAPDSRVRLSAQWRLRAGVDGTPVETRITDLASPALAPEADMDATVAAMSTLWGELGQIIARAIAGRIR